MKKILNLVTILLFLNLNAQEMNENIIITDNISVHQKYTTKSNEIKWELFVKNKKYNKILKIEQINFNPPNLWKEFDLIRPNVIDGFIENNFLYLFIYMGYNVELMKYDLKNYKITKKAIVTIAKLGRGSGDNFGGYKIEILKYRINNKPYFHIAYGRVVGGPYRKLFRYDISLDKAFELKFSENIFIIADKNRTFINLDLDTNKDLIITELKRALLVNDSNIKVDDIKYIGYLEDDISYYDHKRYNEVDSGDTYFYYKVDSSKIKIAKYNHDRYQWHLGTYKEEEMLDKIPEID